MKANIVGMSYTGSPHRCSQKSSRR